MCMYEGGIQCQTLKSACTRNLSGEYTSITGRQQCTYPRCACVMKQFTSLAWKKQPLLHCWEGVRLQDLTKYLQNLTGGRYAVTTVAHRTHVFLSILVNWRSLVTELCLRMFFRNQVQLRLKSVPSDVGPLPFKTCHVSTLSKPKLHSTEEIKIS